LPHAVSIHGAVVSFDRGSAASTARIGGREHHGKVASLEGTFMYICIGYLYVFKDEAFSYFFRIFYQIFCYPPTGIIFFFFFFCSY
jgi:hypothetical protein